MPNQEQDHFVVEQCLTPSCDETAVAFDDNDWETSFHWEDVNQQNKRGLSKLHFILCHVNSCILSILSPKF